MDNPEVQRQVLQSIGTQVDLLVDSHCNLTPFLQLQKFTYVELYVHFQHSFTSYSYASAISNTQHHATSTEHAAFFFTHQPISSPPLNPTYNYLRIYFTLTSSQLPVVCFGVYRVMYLLSSSRAFYIKNSAYIPTCTVHYRKLDMKEDSQNTHNINSPHTVPM
jgi:hypothetical protein